MENKKQNLGSKALVIRLALIMGVLLVFLLILNSLDFSAVSDDKKDEEIEKVTDMTYPPDYFYEPDFEKDILSEKSYLSKDRGIYYTQGNETFYIEEDGYNLNKYSDFFKSYFSYIEGGDEEALNSLCTENYFETVGKAEDFTMQRIYDRRVSVISSAVIEDKENPYYGYTVLLFEVSYKILRNDGTFRRDITGDEVKPIILELLDSGSSIKLNSIGKFRYIDNTGNKKDLITPIVSLLMGVIFIVCSVIAIISRKPIFISFILSSLISFFSAMCGAKWIAVSVIFVIFMVIFIFAVIYRKKLFALIKHKEKTENE